MSRHHSQSLESKNDADSHNDPGNTPVNIVVKKVQRYRSMTLAISGLVVLASYILSLIHI